MKRLAILAALAALAGCGKDKSASGPWLTMPDLASHTALYFPIEAGAVHGPAAGQPLTTCNSCHLDRTTGQPSPSFKTFTCTGCHVQIRPGVYHDDPVALASVVGHPGLLAFDPAAAITAFDRSCRSCHPTGFATDHQKVFPLPHQDTTGTVVAACADCHLSTDRTVLGCASCHPHDQPANATAHARVPDFDPSTTTGASALCARCHGDGTVPVRLASVDPSLAHTGFPITSGLHTGTTGGACLLCHPLLRTDPHKTFAADFTQPTCTGCHVSTPALVGGVSVFHDDSTGMASFHTAQNVANFQFTTAACLDCHPDGSGGAPAYHGQLFPIASGSVHFGIACGACHGPPPAARSDLTSMQCVSCHQTRPTYATAHSAPNGIAIFVALTPPPASCTPVAYTPTNQDCLKCHVQSYHFDPIQLSTVHPRGDSAFGQGEHRAAGCYTCHVQVTQVTATVTPPTTPPQGYPTIDFTKPSPASQSSQGCATCHSFNCGGGG